MSKTAARKRPGRTSDAGVTGMVKLAASGRAGTSPGLYRRQHAPA